MIKLAKLHRIANELICGMLFVSLVLANLDFCDADEKDDTAKDLIRNYFSCILLYEQNQYAEAIPYAERTTEILQLLHGGELAPEYLCNEIFAVMHNNLATLCQSIGLYEKALLLYQEAIEINKKVYGKDHPEVATPINNLASLFHDMGLYEKALPWSQQALEIKRKGFGENHPEVAVYLNNLAELYLHLHSYEKALPLLQEAIQILKRVHGNEHAYIAAALDNLARLYQSTGSYERALPLHQQALDMRKKLLGEEHPEVTVSLNNLAECYRSMGLYEKALPLFQKALEMRKRVLGAKHPEIAKSLSNVALVYTQMEKLEPALAAYDEVVELYGHQYETLLPVLSEKDMLNSIQGERIHLHAVTSLALIYPYTKTKELAFKTTIRTKGRIFSSLSQRMKLSQIDDSFLRKKGDQLRSIQTQLCVLFLSGRGNLSVQKYWSKLGQLNEKKEVLESEIAGRIQEIAPTQEAAKVSIEDVVLAIPENYALVEFVRFYFLDPKKNQRSDARYLAFVLRQGNSEPEMVDLGVAQEIEARFRDFMEEVRIPRLGGLAPLRQKGQALRKHVFDPLLTSLGQTDKVILSPDGVLNLLSFGILPDGKDGFLADTYHFHYVSSGSDMLTWRAALDPKTSPPVVFADPDFDLSLHLPKQSEQLMTMVDKRLSRDHRGMKFNRLAGTARESEAISKTLSEKGLKPKLYLQANAREEFLKQVKSPRLLHLATHGFFLEDLDWGITDKDAQVELLLHIISEASSPEAKSSPWMENPLLRSGLALAGANVDESKKGDDGVLTASESSVLDLQGTEVVVLSACETGLGEIKTGEGVYGLRRSFQLAGAQTVIASLWRVSDKYTAELMSGFYRRWLDGDAKSAALRDSALEIRKRKPHPYYWGAFICLGQM